MMIAAFCKPSKPPLIKIATETAEIKSPHTVMTEFFGFRLPFYSPECQYCRETTPRLAPLAEDLGINLVQYNLKEFEQGWDQYRLNSTPTLIHFEGGAEVGRVVGAATNEEFKQFFNDLVLK